MRDFVVEVKEILLKQIQVQAISKAHAESLVKNMYWNQEIILTPDDCIDYCISSLTDDDKNDQPSLFSKD